MLAAGRASRLRVVLVMRIVSDAPLRAARGIWHPDLGALCSPDRCTSLKPDSSRIDTSILLPYRATARHIASRNTPAIESKNRWPDRRWFERTPDKIRSPTTTVPFSDTVIRVAAS